jgi:hypothetical protein
MTKTLNSKRIFTETQKTGDLRNININNQTLEIHRFRIISTMQTNNPNGARHHPWQFGRNLDDEEIIVIQILEVCVPKSLQLTDQNSHSITGNAPKQGPIEFG